MRPPERDPRKKRLSRLPLLPIRPLKKLIPRIRREVAICLPTHDRREIPRLRQQMRQRPKPIRQALLLMRPMLMRSHKILVKPHHHRRPRSRTNRRSRKRPLIPNSLRRQLIHTRCGKPLRPIAKKIRRPILNTDPQNIRPFVLS